MLVRIDLNGALEEMTLDPKEGARSFNKKIDDLLAEIDKIDIEDIELFEVTVRTRKVVVDENKTEGDATG